MVAFLLWFAWTSYQSMQAEERLAYDAKIAEVTAHLMVASAKYRDQPEVYKSYRDSLLTAWGTVPEEIDSFPTLYEGEVKAYRQFVGLMDAKVDSLFKLEDSIRRLSDTTPPVFDSSAARRDSIAAANSKPRMR